MEITIIANIESIINFFYFLCITNLQYRAGNIIKLSVRGPIRMGLSHTPERYVAKGIRPKTHFPNLFMTGSDLTVDTFSGGIVAGWLTANAVLGYNYLHLSTLSKTISYDLEQFLEEPDGEEEAVLYSEK